MRTGYWLGMGNPSRPATPQHDDDVWKKIWKLHWPPKLKHFLWRACKNSLPVNEICHYRHMAQSPACSRCDGGVENVCHALLDHQSNRSMWLTHPHYSIVQDAPRSSFVDTFRWLLSHASSEELTTIGPSLWACWMCRNKIVMDQSSCDMVQLSTSLVKMIRDYQIYNQKLDFPHTPRVVSYQKWEPPCEGWVKINFDAHVEPNLQGGLGIVFRDAQGTVLLTGTRIIMANWSVPRY